MADLTERQKGMKVHLSVANDITALALINVQDIFNFVLTAKDDEIEERYGTEERAIKIAEQYMEIAERAQRMQMVFLQGWSMKYSQPIKDSDERITKEAYFFDVKKKKKGEIRNEPDIINQNE